MEKFITQDGVVAMSAAAITARSASPRRMLPMPAVCRLCSPRPGTTPSPATSRGMSSASHRSARGRPRPSGSTRSLIPGASRRSAILTENTDYGIPAAAEETRKGLEGGGKQRRDGHVQRRHRDAGLCRDSPANEGGRAQIWSSCWPLARQAITSQQQASDAGIGSLGHRVPRGAGVARDQKRIWENVPDGNYSFVQRIGVPENLFTEEGKGSSPRKYKEMHG